MKKILITGANGFIGSNLTEEALKQDYHVYAGVRKNSDLSNIEKLPVTFVTLDYPNKKSLTGFLKEHGKFDYVVHIAGVTKACKEETFTKVNYEYTRNLVEALIETNQIPEKFIFMSSLAAIGPGDEKTLKPVDDTVKPHPVSAYGRSKLKAEQYLNSLKDFPFIILRPTGVYGPREKDFLLVFKNIRSGFETYIGSKKQHLTFLHVGDLVKLILSLLESNITNKAYFVNDLKYYTVTEFISIVKETLDKKTLTLIFPKPLAALIARLWEKSSCSFFKKPPVFNNDKFKEVIQKNWLCDSSALVRDINFRPEYDLKKGIPQTIQWYKERRML